MSNATDKSTRENDALVEKAKAVLAEQRQTIQRTLAALAETQTALERLQERLQVCSINTCLA